MTTNLAYDKQCILSYVDPEHIKHMPVCIQYVYNAIVGFLIMAGNCSHRETDNH